MWEKIDEVEYLELHKSAVTFLDNSKYSIISKLGYTASELLFAVKLYNNKSGNYIFVSECSDEWYITRCIISSRKMYYKCDQFDGLIDFIKNI